MDYKFALDFVSEHGEREWRVVESDIKTLFMENEINESYVNDVCDSLANRMVLNPSFVDALYDMYKKGQTDYRVDMSSIDESSLTDDKRIDAGNVAYQVSYNLLKRLFKNKIKSKSEEWRLEKAA